MAPGLQVLQYYTHTQYTLYLFIVLLSQISDVGFPPFHWTEDCLVFASLNYVVGPSNNEDMYHGRQTGASRRQAVL